MENSPGICVYIKCKQNYPLISVTKMEALNITVCLSVFLQLFLAIAFQLLRFEYCEGMHICKQLIKKI